MKNLLEPIVIVGLGITGLSCVSYLTQYYSDISLIDSRENPPNLAEFQRLFPNIVHVLGDFDETLLSRAKTLVVNPGVSLQNPNIAKAIAEGAKVLGDIELFAQVAKAPIIAITGSNGKTTVTSLMGEMVENAGFKVKVCGNIGQPVLDLLALPTPDFYVMELSSFQLETTNSLAALTAVLLNLSPDHMDRYADLQAYLAAKLRIYHHCQFPVLNLDEPMTWPVPTPISAYYFSLLKTGPKIFGLMHEAGETYLCFEETRLLNVKELHLEGEHHWQNALAALALGYAVGLPMSSMQKTLQSFQGLPHRCQKVSEVGQVTWYDDSKGTNPGATVAALHTIGKLCKQKLYLIAGGDSKKADLSILQAPVKQYVEMVILIGVDAPLLAKTLADCTKIVRVNSLQEAVQLAYQMAQPLDTVLLSPACASLDMFENYEHRARVFVEAIKELK